MLNGEKNFLLKASNGYRKFTLIFHSRCIIGDGFFLYFHLRSHIRQTIAQHKLVVLVISFLLAVSDLMEWTQLISSIWPNPIHFQTLSCHQSNCDPPVLSSIMSIFLLKVTKVTFEPPV